jgi:thiol-disulfide isomerase/thioredoxin
MTRLSVAMLLTLALVFASGAVATEYTAEAFAQATDPVYDDAELLQICKEYFENTDDIELARKIQDLWTQVDNEGAKEYFTEYCKKSPTSTRAMYLCGRVSDDPIEQIKMGRKIIETDPEWPYGYRLLLATYANYLLLGHGVDVDTTVLAEMLKQDGGYFPKWAELSPDEPYAYQFNYLYQVYIGDFDQAMSTLEKCRDAGLRWVSDGTYASLYAKMGRLNEARDYVVKDVESFASSMSPQEKQYYIQRGYAETLIDAGRVQEAIDYIAGLPSTDTSSEAEYLLACLHAQRGSKEDALKCLAKSAELGWGDVRQMKSDDDLEPLHGDPQFDKIAMTVQTNWDESKDERRAEAIASKVRNPVPSGRLMDVDGSEIPFSDFQGKVVVLDFWATWCGPCRMAMPLINEFVREHKADDVRVISVNVWEKGRSKAEEFMKDHDYAMELMFGSNELTQAFGVTGIPTLVVLDKEGNIRYQESGYHNGLVENLIWWTEDLL